MFLNILKNYCCDICYMSVIFLEVNVVLAYPPHTPLPTPHPGQRLLVVLEWRTSEALHLYILHTSQHSSKHEIYKHIHLFSSHSSTDLSSCKGPLKVEKEVLEDGGMNQVSSLIIKTHPCNLCDSGYNSKSPSGSSESNWGMILVLENWYYPLWYLRLRQDIWNCYKSVYILSFRDYSSIHLWVFTSEYYKTRAVGWVLTEW